MGCTALRRRLTASSRRLATNYTTLITWSALPKTTSSVAAVKAQLEAITAPGLQSDFYAVLAGMTGVNATKVWFTQGITVAAIPTTTTTVDPSDTWVMGWIKAKLGTDCNVLKSSSGVAALRSEMKKASGVANLNNVHLYVTCTGSEAKLSFTISATAAVASKAKEYLDAITTTAWKTRIANAITNAGLATPTLISVTKSDITLLAKYDKYEQSLGTLPSTLKLVVALGAIQILRLACW